jgi:hypothetical protein
MSCNPDSSDEVKRSSPYIYHIKRTVVHLPYDPNAHMY